MKWRLMAVSRCTWIYLLVTYLCKKHHLHPTPPCLSLIYLAKYLTDLFSSTHICTGPTSLPRLAQLTWFFLMCCWTACKPVPLSVSMASGSRS